MRVKNVRPQVYKCRMKGIFISNVLSQCHVILTKRKRNTILKPFIIDPAHIGVSLFKEDSR